MGREDALKERPILFSGEMVRALLNGTKTQTRRICGPATDEHSGHLPAKSVHPDGAGTGWIAWFGGDVSAEETKRRYPGAEGFRCPYGAPGDRLWVRETWAHDAGGGGNCIDHRCGIQGHVWYRASEKDPVVRDSFAGTAKWRPSIFMPRWASRIALEVTDVRVQRLQEISREDCIAEGCPEQDWYRVESGPEKWYATLWGQINGERAPWASNPWVWAITFRRARTGGAEEMSTGTGTHLLLYGETR